MSNISLFAGLLVDRVRKEWWEGRRLKRRGLEQKEVEEVGKVLWEEGNKLLYHIIDSDVSS